MNTRLSLNPFEAKSLGLLTKWGLDTIPSGTTAFPESTTTNWSLLGKLVEALEAEFERGYELWGRLPRNDGYPLR